MEKIPSREIKVEDDFRELLHNNPGALKSFLNLDREINDTDPLTQDNFRDSVFEDGNVRITPLIPEIKNKIERSGDYFSAAIYMKASIGEASFFVKTKAGYEGESLGTEELQSLKQLKAEITENNIEDLEVVDFQLGYKDKDRTYFVSKWLNLPTLNNYLRIHSEHDEEAGQVTKRFDVIKQKLLNLGYRDVHALNTFYDEKTKKFYVFDIFHESLI